MRWLVALTLPLTIALGGCASSTPTPENSAWEGLFTSFSFTRTDPTSNVALSPFSWYLKVQDPASPPVLLAFGYLEQHTTPPTEVWYSGSGQSIKIRDGRIVSTQGLEVDWKDVSSAPSWPLWPSVPPQGTTITRTRSAMPEYDMGIQETLRIFPTAKPVSLLTDSITGASDEKAAHWRWYAESVASSTRTRLPDAVFATANVRGTTVVAYSKQCLSDTYCLHIMRWPQLESTPTP